MDVELQVRRANGKVMCGFSPAWRVGAPKPQTVQVSTIYVCQDIILYNLNLYSDVCQSYLNKTTKRSKSHLTRRALGG